MHDGFVTASLLEALRAGLDDDCIQADPDVVEAYAHDRAIFERAGTGAVVVMPRTAADVVATMHAASSVGVPVVTRGAGTGLCGGANAVDGCVILSMHRMNAVLSIDTSNRMARVQPGVLNGELKRAVAEHGLFYPPDPASYEISSGSSATWALGGSESISARAYTIGLNVEPGCRTAFVARLNCDSW